MGACDTQSIQMKHITRRTHGKRDHTKPQAFRKEKKNVAEKHIRIYYYVIFRLALTRVYTSPYTDSHGYFCRVEILFCYFFSPQLSVVSGSFVFTFITIHFVRKIFKTITVFSKELSCLECLSTCSRHKTAAVNQISPTRQATPTIMVYTHVYSLWVRTIHGKGILKWQRMRRKWFARKYVGLSSRIFNPLLLQ